SIEELAVEHCRTHFARLREAVPLWDHVEGLAVARGMEQGRERVRLAAAEGSDELEDPTARTAGESAQHVLEERPQPARQERRAEKVLGDTVHCRHVRIPVCEGPEVQRE